jgi:hypothetical protein
VRRSEEILPGPVRSVYLCNTPLSVHPSPQPNSLPTAALSWENDHHLLAPQPESRFGMSTNSPTATWSLKTCASTISPGEPDAFQGSSPGEPDAPGEQSPVPPSEPLRQMLDTQSEYAMLLLTVLKVSMLCYS